MNNWHVLLRRNTAWVRAPGCNGKTPCYASACIMLRLSLISKQSFDWDNVLEYHPVFSWCITLRWHSEAVLYWHVIFPLVNWYPRFVLGKIYSSSKHAWQVIIFTLVKARACNIPLGGGLLLESHMLFVWEESSYCATLLHGVFFFRMLYPWEPYQARVPWSNKTFGTLIV